MTTLRTRPSRELVRWRNAVFTIFGLTGFVFATWASRVPAVRDLLGASTQEMGFLILGISAGSIIGLLAASHIVARLGATRTILWLYTAVSVAMIALGVVVFTIPAFAPIFVCLLVVGASSVVDVAMNLSGAANERALGRTMMPLYHAAFSGGTVLGAGVGSLLSRLGVPIGVHFSAVGVVALVVTSVLVRFLQPAEEPIDESVEAPAGGWRERLSVWRSPRVLLIGVIVLGMAFAEGSANDWLSLAMVDGHGFDNAGGAAVLAVFLAAMTAGRIGGVVVLDRFGRVPVLRASAVLAVVGLLIVIVVQNDVAVIVGVVLWGIGAALGFPVGMSAAADDPRTATATVSAVATIGYCAFLVGPPLIGVLGEHVGILPALLVVLVVIAAAGLASSAARRSVGGSRPGSRPDAVDSLTRVIDAQSAEGRDRLLAALGVRRWADDVAASGPYASVDELVAAAGRTGDLTDAELDEAVSHHPRIGEQAEAAGAAAELSAGEQAGLGRRDEGADAAIARGNAVYEGRFGRVFLIRAAGRSRQEVLDELQRRLKNDDEAEAAEAKEQLRQIAALRLGVLFGEAA